MNKIIATTDFSDVSLHAARYACQLAGDIDVAITLIHAYIVPVTFNDTPMPVIPIEETRKMAEERLGSFCKELEEDFTGVSIDCELMYGDIVDCVEEYAAENDVLMVVMGNSSNEGIPLWMGSNLVNALKKLNIPVMGVPIDASYTPVKSICLACDLKDIEKELPIKQLIRLSEKMNTELHILNVVTNDKKQSFENKATISELLYPIIPEYHLVVNDDVDEGIKLFVADNDFDWLMVAPHKYSFLERIFHRSHTNAMVRMMDIPVVALHREVK